MSGRRRSPSKSTPARSARVRSGSGLRATPDEGRRRRAAVSNSTADGAGAPPRSGSGALGVGQRVLVCGIKTGVVGYIGATTFGDGVWVGVHLDRPQGLNDGSVAGKRYFTCEPNHGVFVRKDRVQAYSPEAAAAGSIQAASRRHLARRKVDEAMNWKMFNTLDEHEEHLHIERRRKLLGAGLTLPQPAAISLDGGFERMAAVHVEDDYAGAHLRFPLKLDNVMEVLDNFKFGRQLHYKYTMQVLLEFRRVCGSLPTLNRLTVEKGTQLTVCGDLHGQLQDLFSIFTINDLPSEQNHYLFNGDLVDRGDFGCEVVLTVLIFKLLYPNCVHINRGNHEDRAQNETAGFLAEVLRKYKGSGDAAGRGGRVYALFESVFESLPIASVVDDKIFIMHGGLFRRKGVRLSHIAAVKRRRSIPVRSSSFEDTVFEDLMWSDPRPITGSQQSDRGAGVFWGSDITHQFCKLNGIEFIVRSHECVPNGYKFHHSNRVMSLFSASRYMGTYSNKGAFLVLEHGSRKNLQQFIAHSMGAVDLTSPAETDKRQEQEILTMVVQHIVNKKPELYWFLTHADTEHVGKVTKLEWADAMRTVLGLDLPWMRLASKLADIDPEDHRINYGMFLDRYRIEMSEEHNEWQDQIIERICEKLFQTCSNLEQAYKMFDVNRDGKIEYEEFVQTLVSLKLGMNEQQMYELMATIDKDRDSHIDMAEFAQRFRVVFTQMEASAESKDAGGKRPAMPHLMSWRTIKLGAKPSFRNKLDAIADGKADDGAEGPEVTTASMDKATREAVTRIGAAMFKTGTNAQLLFRDIDTDGSGTLSVTEFAVAIKALGLRFPKAELRRILTAIDTNGSGQIDYLEFIAAFKVADFGGRGRHKGLDRDTAAGSKDGSGEDADGELDGPSTPWEQRVVDHIVNTLFVTPFEYRIELTAAFQLYDVDGTGSVTKAQFRDGLMALARSVGEDLTDMQVNELIRHLEGDDDSEDGVIDYTDFFGAFAIVDTKTGHHSLPPNPPQHSAYHVQSDTSIGNAPLPRSPHGSRASSRRGSAASIGSPSVGTGAGPGAGAGAAAARTGGRSPSARSPAARAGKKK